MSDFVELTTWGSFQGLEVNGELEAALEDNSRIQAELTAALEDRDRIQAELTAALHRANEENEQLAAQLKGTQEVAELAQRELEAVEQDYDTVVQAERAAVMMIAVCSGWNECGVVQGLQLQQELEVANEERAQLKADCVRLTQQLLPRPNQLEEHGLLEELKEAGIQLEQDKSALEAQSDEDSRLIAQLQQKASE